MHTSFVFLFIFICSSATNVQSQSTRNLCSEWILIFAIRFELASTCPPRLFSSPAPRDTSPPPRRSTWQSWPWWPDERDSKELDGEYRRRRRSSLFLRALQEKKCLNSYYKMFSVELTLICPRGILIRISSKSSSRGLEGVLVINVLFFLNQTSSGGLL